MKNYKNQKWVLIEFAGNGHYKVTTEYYGTEISALLNDSMSVDDYRSDDSRRSNRGLKSLRSQVIAFRKKEIEKMNMLKHACKNS